MELSVSVAGLTENGDPRKAGKEQNCERAEREIKDLREAREEGEDGAKNLVWGIKWSSTW